MLCVKLLQEQLLAWKKEKRRKQNREAQRRRRDRNIPPSMSCINEDFCLSLVLNEIVPP
jgi:hypothetical protein